MSLQRLQFGIRSGLSACVVAAVIVAPAGASVRDPFPDPRPATQAAAVALVAGEAETPQGCLTSHIQKLQQPSYGTNPLLLRALGFLERRSFTGAEQVAYSPDGVRVVYSTDSGGFDSIVPADADGDSRPDLLEQVLDGLGEARALLVDRLHLPEPANLQVVFLELGPGLDGYVISRPRRPSQQTIVLDASPSPDGARARQSVIHQYAHAVARAAGARFPIEWGEALATWATLTLDGQPDTVTAGLLSDRIEALAEGLTSPDRVLAPGNALWFAFLDEAYGPAAVSVTVRELARPGPVDRALDRALSRISHDSLAEAFAEFHLWTVLIGDRADSYHFPFASRLAPVEFASSVEGLPALSVQTDPSVAAWGATQVLIRPEDSSGGLRIRFEGEFGSGWEADLLLVGTTGTLRRLPLALSAEGQGEATVPLDGLDEVLLLVRNLGGEDGDHRRYTYAAHRESAYPYDLTAFEASPVEDGTGIDVAWQTASEEELIGFNILRVREAGGSEVVVNPVWIPALGDAINATSYRFVDRTADPETSYIYRIQGITKDGLTSLSTPALVKRSATP